MCAVIACYHCMATPSGAQSTSAVEIEARWEQACIVHSGKLARWLTGISMKVATAASRELNTASPIGRDVTLSRGRASGSGRSD